MEDGLMGEFAKGKINQVYYFLHDKESEVQTKEEAQNIINIIGDDLLQKQLQKIFNEKYNEKSKDDLIYELQKRIEELESKKNDSN